MIIGIDISTNPKKLGLTACAVKGQNLEICAAQLAGTHDAALEFVADYWQPSTILAIDAPLGWPREMAIQLQQHKAGEPFLVDRNTMFRRLTDERIAERTGKRPLDVGADLIARAAHYALELLGDVRAQLGAPLPMLWSPHDRGGAIEVYPAATLDVRGLPSSGYKGKEPELRKQILEQLPLICAAEIQTALLDNNDVFDAAIAALAGWDFMESRCEAPADDELERAKSEGWIWVANPM